MILARQSEGHGRRPPASTRDIFAYVEEQPRRCPLFVAQLSRRRRRISAQEMHGCLIIWLRRCARAGLACGTCPFVVIFVIVLPNAAMVTPSTRVGIVPDWFPWIAGITVSFQLFDSCASRHLGKNRSVWHAIGTPLS